MRILHTSDWHIGHRLYEQHRIEEHRQFLDWLLTTLQENAETANDVLLVAGDIFDTALPSSEATDLYYQFLFQLYDETHAHAVITAGRKEAMTLRRVWLRPVSFLEWDEFTSLGLHLNPRNALPSSEATDLYYQFLFPMRHTPTLSLPPVTRLPEALGCAPRVS